MNFYTSQNSVKGENLYKSLKIKTGFNGTRK